MTEERAATRYAEALFGLAKERSELERSDNELLQVRQILDKYPEVTHLVLNSTVSAKEKELFLEKILGSKISQLILNFIKVLIRKKRFPDLQKIQALFHQRVEKAQGISEVTAVSGRPLSDEAERKLTVVLEKKLQRKVRLIKEIDPQIIGGLILRFDGSEINASFKNRLSEMKQKLTA